jgi:hypothetical protein
MKRKTEGSWMIICFTFNVYMQLPLTLTLLCVVAYTTMLRPNWTSSSVQVENFFMFIMCCSHARIR